MEVKIWNSTILTHNDYLWKNISKHKDYYERAYLDFSHERTKFNVWYIIDVGANIWNHSHYRATHWHKVIAIEPSIDNYNLLTQNTEQLWVICHNVAISNRVVWYWTIINNNNRWNDKIEMYHSLNKDEALFTERLDSFDDITQKRWVKLIKVDVEELELEVLQSWFMLIQRYLPDLMVEVNDKKTLDYILWLWYKKILWKNKNKTIYFSHKINE